MSHSSDFTTAQAQDLARHFLGSEYSAWVGPITPAACVLGIAGKATGYYCAPTWRKAFRRVGVKLPYRKRFVSLKNHVILDDTCMAICCSANFAVRTAAALNAYEPNERGQ